MHQRGILAETARITQGGVSLVELDVTEYDALIVPGGFGAANLSTFALPARTSSTPAWAMRSAFRAGQANRPVLHRSRPRRQGAARRCRAYGGIGGGGRPALAVRRHGGGEGEAKHVLTELDEVHVDDGTSSPPPRTCDAASRGV